MKTNMLIVEIFFLVCILGGKYQYYIIPIVSHSNEGDKAAHSCQCQTCCGNSKINQNDISNFFPFLIRPKHQETSSRSISKTRCPHHSQPGSCIFSQKMRALTVT